MNTLPGRESVRMGTRPFSNRIVDMYRNIFLALALAAGTSAVMADTMNISYAEGKNTNGAPVGVAFGDLNEIESAFYLPESTVKLLTGNKIAGINGCLTSNADISNVYIFVRSKLDGENLAYFKLTPNQLNPVKRGVNKLKFKTPWTIPADLEGGLYIGFGYIITDDNARGLSANSTPIPGAFFLRRRDGKWYDFSDKGSASIEAVIEGDNLPGVNLRLSRVDTPEAFVMSKGNLDVRFFVHNFGTRAVSAFDIVAEIEGKEVARQRVTQTVEPNAMGVCTVSLRPEVAQSGDKEVTYRIEGIAEGADEDMADNARDGEFEAVAKDYPRHILSEEFTTESCGSCPPVVEMLHGLLQKPEYANVIQVAHHAGYKTDHLTTPFHETYVSLFGGGSFAPGLCVERRAYETWDQVYFPEDEKMVTEVWDAALSKPALVSVNLTANYTDEAENKLRVNVWGEKSTLHLAQNPVVTVWLVENGLPSKHQASATKDFIHNHVTRAVGSADVWGDPVSFEGDTYSYTCTMDLDPSWVKENMEVVAFLGENTGKYNGHEVKNAAVMPFSAIGDTGVQGVAADSPVVSTEYFDLAGRRIAEPTQGIAIKRVTRADGSVRTFKTVVR